MNTNSIGDNQRLTLGDLVRIKDGSPCGGGKLAYVYETYSDFDDKGELGIQLITEDGLDTGGWSWAEQKFWLEYVGRAGWDYEFKNVIQLDHDFRTGIFDKVFKKNNWHCGKCDQDAGLYPGGEILPEHSRHCLKRK